MADAWRSLTRRFSAKPARIDWLLAGAFTLAAELEVLIRLPQPSLEQELDTFAALALLGLAWRRRRPLIPLVLLTGSTVASVIAGARLPMDVPQVALLFATYSLGAYAGNIELGVGALLPTAMAAAIDLLLPNPPVPLLNGLAWYAIFVTGAPVFIGRLVRSRSRLVERLEQQRTALVAARDAGAKRALTAERQRMSRQLRDVVIHSVDSLIVDVAIAEANPGEIGLAAVVRIESVARKALVDMRPLLGALGRQEAEETPAREDPPAEPPHFNADPGPVSALAPRLQAALDMAPWPVIVAALVLVFLEAGNQDLGPSHSPRLLIDTSLIGIAAPIAWSRARPLAAAAISVFALAAISRFVIPIPFTGLPSVVLSLYLPFSVAAFSDGRKALVGLVVCAIGFIGAYGSQAPPALVFGGLRLGGRSIA